MLTIVQDRWYWAAWQPCYDALRRSGMGRSEALGMRHEIQARALRGGPVSHKELDEADLRIVMAAFREEARSRRPRVLMPESEPLQLSA